MTTTPLTSLPARTVVVKVISPRRVVISRGAADQVKDGQTFLVYALGEPLVDPNDGRDLGQLEIVKGRGKVIHLQERVATLESIEVERKRVRRTSAIGVMLAIPETTETVNDAPFEDARIGDFCRPI